MEILGSFQSSSIRWVGYDRENRVLHVVYTDNNTEYEYEGVSPGKWNALNRAGSKGRYINFHIKPFHKVTHSG